MAARGARCRFAKTKRPLRVADGVAPRGACRRVQCAVVQSTIRSNRSSVSGCSGLLADVRAPLPHRALRRYRCTAARPSRPPDAHAAVERPEATQPSYRGHGAKAHAERHNRGVPAQPQQRADAAVVERDEHVAGLRTHLLEAPAPGRGRRSPVLYLHGNPVASWIWRPLLERTGGLAPDLPGFGRSAKPPDFDYSLPGYAEHLERLVDQLGLDRLRLVAHDIGAIIGLVVAQRIRERIERLVIANHAPLLPGYRWHRLARIWRVPGLGELSMAGMNGFTFRRSLRPSNAKGLPDWFIDRAWADVDGATKRAILRLYRSMPEDVLAHEGRNLARIDCPALVVWSTEDPYIGQQFGPVYGEALGGEVDVAVYEDAGHWLWLDRPEAIDRMLKFLEGRA